MRGVLNNLKENYMYDNLINEIKQRQLDMQNEFIEEEIEVGKKIPIACWLHDPDSFNKEQFYKETIEFLFAIYSNAADIDKHLVGMLADTLETYIECKKVLDREGYVIEFNNGKTLGTNPLYKTMDNAVSSYISITNELQISLKARVKNGVKEPTEVDEAIKKLMRGPEFYR
jgi:P27 family predicted phage terminase small subunit